MFCLNFVEVTEKSNFRLLNFIYLDFLSQVLWKALHLMCILLYIVIRTFPKVQIIKSYSVLSRRQFKPLACGIEGRLFFHIKLTIKCSHIKNFTSIINYNIFYLCKASTYPLLIECRKIFFVLRFYKKKTHTKADTWLVDTIGTLLGLLRDDGNYIKKWDILNDGADIVAH